MMTSSIFQSLTILSTYNNKNTRGGALITQNKTLAWAKIFIFFSSAFLSCMAMANPVVNNVGAGQVSIQQQSNVTVINQTSQKGIINWKSFNIGAKESTHFNQPAGGVTLNRISPTQGASQIYGSLTATGKIILVNPAGVYFGPNSFVNVGGLIATTASIRDQDFLNDHYNFTASGGHGAIVNEGQIIARDNGLVALIAPGVINHGLIKANLGRIVLASGEAFTMDFYGDQLINFAITQKTTQQGVDKDGNAVRDGVKNTGSLIADGGSILVTAQAAKGVLDNVINMGGVVQAQSVGQENGEITLSGDVDAGTVNVSGKLVASGTQAGEIGGNIVVTGYQILLANTASLNVNGYAGGGNINIGGSYQGKGTLPNASALVVASGANIAANAINTGNGGNIILWANDVNKVYGNISATGGALSGNGGFVETSSKNYLEVGNISVNTSAAHGTLGTWLLDPRNIDIISGSTSGFDTSNPNTFVATSDNAQVSASTIMNNLATANVVITTGSTGTQSGDITVSAPITWSSSNSLTLSAYRDIILNAAITNTTSNAAILNLITNNAGNFAVGSGYGKVTYATGGSINVIGTTNIYYNPTSYTSPTVFPSSGGTLRSFMYINSALDLQTLSTNSSLWSKNFALSKDIDLSSLVNYAAIGTVGTNYTGIFDGLNHALKNLTMTSSVASGIFGYLSGTIRNVGVVNINLTANGGNSGGLLGVLNSGTVSNSYATGTINAGTTGGVGGLVGVVSTGTVSNSYAEMNVTAGANSGGLVGYMTVGGTITGSHATGVIHGSGGAIGGLVGGNNGGTINTSYSGGTVIMTSGNFVGGLVGNSPSGSITNSYSYATVIGTGSTYVAGLVGNLGSAGIGATLTNSYSSGSVSGGSVIGGLVGNRFALASITNSFWDTTTSGQSTGVGAGAQTGATGKTTAQMMSSATYSSPGWSISSTGLGSTWVIFEGLTRPMLSSEYSTTISNAHQLQLIGLNTTTLNANYTVVRDFSASGTTNASDVWGTKGFTPIGTLSTPFTGSLDGQDYTISDLYINQSSTSSTAGVNVGMVGVNDGTVKNVTLSNASIAGITNVGGLVGQNLGIVSGSGINSGTITGSVAVGGIVGLNEDIVTDSWNFGAVNSASSGSGSLDIGGVVGHNSGTVSASYNTGTITGLASNQNIGGVVGLNDATGVFTTSYNLGKIVAGTNSANIGGLVGQNAGVLSNAYSMGPVVAGAGSTAVGGLAGLNSNSISNTYSIGVATVGGASTGAGGLVGVNTGSVGSSYWDTETSGNQTSAAGTGKTTAQLMQQATYVGWDFSTVWQMTENESFPFLQAAYQTARAVSGFLVSNTSDVIGLSSANTASQNFVDTTYIGANGFYYFLEGSNLISNQNHALADNTPFLIYSTGATKVNIAGKAPVGGGNVTNLTNRTANSLLLSSSLGISNSDLAAVQNSLASTDILYTHSGNNITLGNAVNNTVLLNSNADTLYTINGTLGTVSGGITSLNLSGATNVSGGSVTTSGAQTYTGQVTLSAATALTGTNITFGSGIVGGNNLTLNANNISITGALALNNLVINGTGGNNSLLLNTGIAQQFNITGVNAGSITLAGLNSSSFSNIQNITGGSGNDSFVFSDGQYVTGNLNGGAGTNALNYSAYSTAINILSTSAQNGTATGIGGTYANMQSFIGNGLSTTFNATNTTNTWNLTGSNSGTLNGTVSFANVTNLMGGASADTFTVQSGATFTGTINGGAGSNSLIYQGTSPVLITLSNATDGTATGIGGFSNIQSFTGNGAHTTLTAANTANNWLITSADAGTLNGVTSFSNVGNLTGGTDSDTFTLNSGASLSGGINGNSGNNSLIYNTSSPVSVTLSSVSGSGTATGFSGGFSNIQNIMGSTGNNSFTGANVNSTWNITSASAGNVNGVNFSRFANLIGGSQNDTFVFAPGASVATINGGGGSANSMDYTGWTSAVTVDLNTVTNIQSLLGGSGNNTLLGRNIVNTWSLTGTNAGSVSNSTGLLSFTNFANLTGGNNSNTYIIANASAKLTGTLNGGSSANMNTLDFSQGFNSPITVTLIGNIFSGNAGNVLTGYTNINQLIGNVNSTNTINLPAGKTSSAIVMTGKRSGYIGDPLYFVNFDFPTPVTPVTPPTVAPVVQPWNNNPVVTNPNFNPGTIAISNNLGSLIQDLNNQYTNYINSLTVNLNCGGYQPKVTER